ncbi:hypothetical protein HG530_009718 [Fusarium avenaceum]|nr:hypothetical protein HG530_009718 [Fusarium avenaceum]
MPILITQLSSNRMPLAGVWIIPIQGRHLIRRIKRVERDLSRALPLRNVDLWRPSTRGIEPERRPCPLVHGGDELSTDVIPAARTSGNLSNTAKFFLVGDLLALCPVRPDLLDEGSVDGVSVQRVPNAFKNNLHGLLGPCGAFTKSSTIEFSVAVRIVEVVFHIWA